MANDPEEAGQPVSGKPDHSPSAGNASADPNASNPGAGQSTPKPAGDESAHSEADSQSAGEPLDSGAQNDAASQPEASTESGSHLSSSGGSHGSTEDSVPDPAYEGYSEYQHQDDPYHNDPYHHDDPHHYDGHHDDPYHTTGEEGHQPQGDYYHEPGAYDTGSSSHSDEHHSDSNAEGEDVGFDGLFGGDTEGEGGPVKPFLDHLEDLRWVIIKCIASVLVAMVVCLVATPVIVWLLKWPLEHPLFTPKVQDKPVIRLQVSTNQVEFELPTKTWGPIPVATNEVTTFELVPVDLGTNVVLALKPVPDAPKVPKRKVPLINIKSVPDSFSIAIQIALWGGVGIASPILMLLIGQFIVPALKQKERKYLYKGVAIGGGLFVAGVMFCYFVVMRVAILATVDFASWMGFASEIWDAGEYIMFCVKFMVGMGLCFQVPVILLTLVKIGILDYRRLNTMRPFWIIGNLILSGFVTPDGNPFTMMLMAAPIHLLYEISVIIAWWWDRQDRKRELAEQKANGQSQQD